MKSVVIGFGLLIFVLLVLFQMARFSPFHATLSRNGGSLSSVLCLYASTVMIVFYMITWISLKQGALGYAATEVAGYLGMVLSLAFVFFGIRYYRDHVNGGNLTFGKG